MHISKLDAPQQGGGSGGYQPDKKDGPIPPPPRPRGVTILETPQSLCRREAEARDVGRLVAMEPDTVRQVAESWHADREKIKYLESLLVRMGRG